MKKRNAPFGRPGRRLVGSRLPGQSTAADLIPNVSYKVTAAGDPAATVLNQELVQIGDLSANRYVQIDAAGLALFVDSGGTVQLNFKEGTATIATLYALVDGQTSQLLIAGRGKDSSNHEAAVQLQALTDDGLAHAGVAQVYLLLETAGDRCTIAAAETRLGELLKLTGISSANRDNLSAQAGMIIFNSTTAKLQVYDGSNWLDLH